MKKIFSRLGSSIVPVVIALFLMFPGAAYAQTGPGLLQFGPVANGPLTLFPSWYMDKTGLALEACLDGLPFCLSSPADLDPVLGAGEAFYWAASVDLADPGGANGFVEFALEAAFLNPVLTIDNAMVFNRLRIRMDALPAGGNYTLTHPFGQSVHTAIVDPQNPLLFSINDTIDLPGSSGIASFSGVLNAPNIGPFLIATNAPPGFIGDNVTPSTVTGGINGNSVTLTGGGLTLTSDLFIVQGKIATNGGLSGVKATYSRTATGLRTATASASSVGGQNIVALFGPLPKPKQKFRSVLAPVPGQLGNYASSVNFGPNAVISPVRFRNLSDASLAETFVNITDVITITQATWVGGILTVQANSSDLLPPGPTLQLVDPVVGTVIATGTGGVLNATIASPFKPARVRVISSAGGVRGAPVP